MERVWRKPSEEDKQKSKKLWETDPEAEADPAVADKKVRFGYTRTVEYSPIEGETEETDWRMFPENEDPTHSEFKQTSSTRE